MPPLYSISDTARWVAVYRALESERRDALFRDTHARRLAGAKGEAIARSIPRGRSIAWAIVVRTCLLDELILGAVERDGVDLVLNLASGLDTRPYRLPLPASLRWVEVDLPEISEHKRACLAGDHPVCSVESVVLDLADGEGRRALFRRLGEAAERVLVVTEGLLVYLPPEQVGALASDLHTVPQFRWWLTDIVSPQLLRMLQRRSGKSFAGGNTAMRFGPEEGAEFFRPHGWHPVEFRSILEEGQRLGRQPPGAWLWRWLSRFVSAERRESYRRMSGIVRLERSGPPPGPEPGRREVPS